MPYEGEIKIGDQFEWCPYGDPGWPHAWALVKVTGILSHGEDMPFTDSEDDQPEAAAIIECEDQKGKRYWNDLSRFREACKKVSSST
jgi:hypothetical protein